jgi:NADH:ubiquinone oxidoreductase subunit 5 (subunit L)/multisubunit Na+/H+ antiporter MnhA subunit
MLVYFWRLIETAMVKRAPTNETVTVGEIPPSMLLPLMVMGLLTFLMGLAWMSGRLTPLLNHINAAFGLGGP